MLPAWCAIRIVPFWLCVNNFQAVVQEFELQFPDFLPCQPPPALSLLNDAIRYCSLSPGKRLRPYLLLETARIFAADKQQALAAAAAIECVHVYSLAHDDLPAMDDDDERRGQPTLHKKYDEATAILAGDALLTLAFAILGEHAPQLVKPLAEAAGWRGMVGGQVMDLAAEHKPLSLEEIITLQRLKTGALFDFCTQAGAMLGNASATEKEALAEYTAALGLLFQLTDDLLDAEGDPAKLGKAARKDNAAGKATTINLLGIEGAKKLVTEQSAKAKEALLKLKGREVLHLSGLIDFIQNREC